MAVAWRAPDENPPSASTTTKSRFAVGLSPAQHQLLLAIRGHAGDEAPTISDVAESLLLKRHSAVELVDRAERRRLVRRVPDRDDHRVIRLELTATGRKKLDALSALALEELRRLAPQLAPIWEGLDA